MSIIRQLAHLCYGFSTALLNISCHCTRDVTTSIELSIFATDVDLYIISSVPLVLWILTVENWHRTASADGVGNTSLYQLSNGASIAIRSLESIPRP